MKLKDFVHLSEIEMEKIIKDSKKSFNKNDPFSIRDVVVAISMSYLVQQPRAPDKDLGLRWAVPQSSQRVYIVLLV